MRLFFSLVIIMLVFFSGCGHHQPAPVEEKSTVSTKRQLNSDGTYSVRSGDTLYAIAFHYGLDPQDIAKWNRISSPYLIHPGQKLHLYAPPTGDNRNEKSPGVQISAAKTPARAETRTVKKPDPAPQTGSNKMVKNPVPETTPAVKNPIPVSANPKDWRWPAEGRVLRTFVANDPARNGLDIAGREGQAILAAQAGQIVYSGNGLIGYGELIIIKHSESMLSAYAHNKVRLVNEGEQVSSAQKIAEMGRNAGNEQILHFEIRVRGKPVNPLTYLPKK
jgi:lipoprotein NlpD